MEKYYDIAVTFGGISSENEVSVVTGTLACNVLKKGGKRVLPIYFDRDGSVYADERLADITVYKGGSFGSFLQCGFCGGGVIMLKRGKPKAKIDIGCVLNCCHGGVGEGGGLSGLCAALNLPFASANLFESSCFLNKYFTKLVLQSLGIKTAKYAYSQDITGAIEGARGLGYPVIVKPVTLGSSIGVAKCDDEEELAAALQTAFELDGGVLIEEYLSPRREINCAIYCANGRATVSPCEEAESGGDVLSYDDKYCGGGRRIFPAKLNDGVAEEIQKLTEKVYCSLNMRGITRFDYIICRNEIYLSEINTVPGSLSQYLVSENYNGFYKVLCGVIEQAQSDFAAAKGKRIISTGILNDLTVNACKIK